MNAQLGTIKTRGGTSLDLRTTALRNGVAARSLQESGIIAVDRFVTGYRAQIKESCAFLYLEPREDSEPVSMLNFLEEVMVYEFGSDSGRWVMAQCLHDDYVGFLPKSAFSVSLLRPTHRVNVLTANVYSKPSFKHPTVTKLGLWTGVESRLSQDGFAEISAMGWVKETDLISIEGGFNPDNNEYWGLASAAERMKGVPYVWSGRNTAVGVDCSGKMQLAFAAVGIRAQRDTDQQQELGVEEEVPKRGELGVWTRDLVLFWPGHVAISLGREYIIHASMRHGAVCTQSYYEAVEQRGMPTAARRIAVP